MSDWKPENIFHKKTDGIYNGVLYVQEALKRLGPVEKRIVTSREPGMREIEDSLRRPGMPEGIEKWQLPIIISEGRPSFLFVTVAAPDTHVGKHMHPDDVIVRIIMSGSITVDGVELSEGDWMYVPNTVPYSYTAGRLGAVMFHIYNCGGGIIAGRDTWQIHGFPGGGLSIFEGPKTSEIPTEWL